MTGAWQAADLSGGAGETVVRAPDGATTVMFRRTSEGRADVLVIGPRSRATYHRKADPPFCAGLRIPPERARPLLGAALPELVDRIVPLGSLWDGAADRLTAELADLLADGADGPAADAEGRVRAALGAALSERLAGRPDAEVRRFAVLGPAAERLATAPVRLVAQDLGMSERHLRQLFVTGVGLPPKRFARIGRVRAAADLTGRRRLAGLAADAGFYDQAHMTAEFRALMGVPPAAYAAGRLPRAGGCSALGR